MNNKPAMAKKKGKVHQKRVKESGREQCVTTRNEIDVENGVTADYIILN